jgi:nicotinate phosphoribosyltransferase
MSGAGGGRVAADRQSALSVDLYELTMAESYLAEGIHLRPATFSLFVRTLPAGWGYLVAAGLDDILDFLESFRFDARDLADLQHTGLFTVGFLEHLSELRFRGEVRALPEGTVFFPDEPLLEVTAPLLEAQIVETAVLNELHFQSLIAGKAARSVEVADGRALVDFGLRRTHGPGAGLRVARASYLAGFDATSNVLAGRTYGIPVSGTMAHSYVQSFDSELEAFGAYARAYPDRAILLVDTYDTEEGVRTAALVGRELAERGHALAGVRLDSGDLAQLSRRARAILDEAGLQATTIFASGGLDEHDIARFVREGAPIDGFGVGSRLGTAADSPYLDMAYKLVELEGRPKLKLSAAKSTLPGRKQVWRISLADQFAYDVLTPLGGPEPPGGEPLLELVMQAGNRVRSEPLSAARKRCAAQRAALPEEQRRLDAGPYDVRIAGSLLELRDRAIAELGRIAPSRAGRGEISGRGPSCR